MKIEIDALLDDWLSRWHEFSSGYRMTRGYSGSDATCRDHRTPTHWDWQNGAEEDRGMKEEMKAFDKAIRRVPNHPERWFTCLAFEARNLASAAAVWKSPYLPIGEELAVLRIEARTKLIEELSRDGIIGA
jgi:hypothetical protein